MNAPSKDILDLLVANVTFSYTAATNIFYNRTPPSPSNCVVVTDLEGEQPLLQLSPDQGSYHIPAITVSVRNTNHNTAYVEASAIMGYLHGLKGVTQGGAFYVIITAMGEPHLLQYDDNDRAVVIVNYRIQRREP